MTKTLHPYAVLLKPLVTEKSTMLSEEGKYVFAVAPSANKMQIKAAVELAFNVQVSAVNVLKVHGKPRRIGRYTGKGTDWKKAVVTVAEGGRIDLFEGV